MNHSPRALQKPYVEKHLQLPLNQHNDVFKSNNIIFTLNLLTTNLMNNNVFVTNTMQK